MYIFWGKENPKLVILFFVCLQFMYNYSNGNHRIVNNIQQSTFNNECTVLYYVCVLGILKDEYMEQEWT